MADLDVGTVAQQAGMRAGRGNSLAPCPACGADQRGRHDRRGPIVVTSRQGRELWHCHAAGCGAGGDAVTLRALVLFGEVPPKGDARWREVLGDTPAPARSRPVKAPATPTRRYPPPDEVAALWGAALPVDEASADALALAWLVSRGLDPFRVVEWDLVRVLPPVGPAWPWVRSYVPRTHPVVFPLYDAAGRLRSVRFRAVVPDPKPAKAVPPSWYEDADGRHDFEVGGLVLADPMARRILAGERPAGWDGRVIVCEGEPDWLTWAAHPSRRLDGATPTYAVFGLFSGAWSADIGARVPDGARVVIREHDDDKGRSYTKNVVETLNNRCDVRVAHGR